MIVSEISIIFKILTLISAGGTYLHSDRWLLGIHATNTSVYLRQSDDGKDFGLIWLDCGNLPGGDV